MNYKHTQIGYLIIFILLFVSLIFGGIFLKAGFDLILIGVMVFILFIVASFSTLNVEIDEEYLKIKFGYGRYKKRFPIKGIVSAKSARNHWYNG